MRKSTLDGLFDDYEDSIMHQLVGICSIEFMGLTVFYDVLTFRTCSII